MIIVCGRKMVLCSMTMIADAARILVPGAEKTESLTELFADDMEMIVKETELIGTTVLSKGKTGGMEADETSVSDVKQSACLVWFVVFPSMPAYKACGVPFLTDRLSRVFNGLADGSRRRSRRVTFSTTRYHDVEGLTQCHALPRLDWKT